MRVAADALQSFIAELFVRQGAAEAEARDVAEHLVGSNLAGHDSHGVMRSTWYMEKIDKGEIVPGAPIDVARSSATTAALDGHWGFGQPIARRGMELAIEKAAEHDLGCVTVRRCNHVGRLGAYTKLASARGFVGIAMANLHGTSHCVAPFGGIDRKLPTNPISIAFPRGSTPDFLLDMTSSIVAEGRLKMKLNRGEPLPDGWAIDSEGLPASDASQFYNEPRGAILPLGGPVGYKGFGLSLAIDALSGALSGAECSNPRGGQHGNACLFLALRIEAFCPLSEFEAKVSALMSHVASSRPMPGVRAVIIPGEPEGVAEEAGARSGIDVDEVTWEALRQRAMRAGIGAQIPQAISAPPKPVEARS